MSPGGTIPQASYAYQKDFQQDMEFFRYKRLYKSFTSLYYEVYTSQIYVFIK